MIAIASDHGGLETKEEIKNFLQSAGHTVADLGTNNSESVDYPDFGIDLSRRVAAGEFEKGILVCGTGIGMSIVANKFPGVRAALCSEDYSAKMSRLHNDSNILVLPGRVIDTETAKGIVKIWFTTDFEGGRHQKRLDKITAIEGKLRSK